MPLYGKVPESHSCVTAQFHNATKGNDLLPDSGCADVL